MIPHTFTPAPPLEVWCDPRTGTPRRLRWRGRPAWVATVEHSWHWTAGWWQERAANRHDHRLTTRDGLRCVLYRDLATNRWHLEAILD